MSDLNIKKYKYIGKVRSGLNPSILIYLSDGVVKQVTGELGSPKEGLIEVKHQASGDVHYYSSEQFKKWFNPL